MPARLLGVQPDRSSSWRAHVAAAVVLVLASPVAAWWLMDVLASSEQLVDPDYAVKPMRIDPTTKFLVGLVAVSLIVAAVLTCIFIGVDRRFVRRWWTVVAPLVAAGVICGAGWAVMTAPVIGANIGAGLVVLGAPPVVLTLLACAVARWIWLLMRAVPLDRWP